VLRIHGLVASLGLWLVSVITGLIFQKLGIGGEYPFWSMLVTSGVVGGFAGSFIFARPGADRSPVSAILLLGYASIGFYQMLHGDASGIILVLMWGGAAIGSLLASQLPITVAGIEASADSARDEG